MANQTKWTIIIFTLVTDMTKYSSRDEETLAFHKKTHSSFKFIKISFSKCSTVTFFNHFGLNFHSLSKLLHDACIGL